MAGGPAGPPQWPSQGYPDQGQPPPAQGYHFPPPEPDQGYGHHQQVYAPAQWGQQGDPPGYDLANYLPPEPGPFQHHQQQAYESEAEYGEEYFEDEERRPARRWLFIAAALVGAIGVGGALAYTYKSIVAPDGGRVPLVKAERNVKVKPDDPGGKEFPGSDRKLPNRLVEGTVPPGPEASGAGEKDLGPRPVKTIKIGASAAPSPEVAAVPGITLENFAPPPPAAAAPSAAEPRPAKEVEPPPAAVGPPPARPAAKADPPPAEPADPPAAPVARKPPPVVAGIAPPRVKEPAPRRVREPAPPPSSSGLGYVAVVSSKKTHIDALKAYADVAQKHPDVLSGKTPDVQEANLGDRGIWYRAVVGPPGSRESARSLCDRLKAAGQDCWIKEF